MASIITSKGFKALFAFNNFSKISLCIRSAGSIHSDPENKRPENQERDCVNFPRPQRAEYPGKVRLGFIPQEWFDILYHKTGITGPYVIMFGIAAFLVSKELYVLEHNFFNGVSIAATSAVGMKTIGPHIAAHADKRIELIEKQYKDIHKEAIRQYEEAIILEKHEQWRAEGQLLLLDAKRKSVAIQLEAEYRERVMDAYNKVKQHLDWELEQERVIRALAQKHMVQWVRSEVGHTIVSSAFEKRFIKQCIEELTSIAQTKETFLQGGSESNYKL